MFTLLLSPPEIPFFIWSPIMLSAMWSILSNFITSFTLSSFWASFMMEGSLIWAANMRCSFTVKVASIKSSCRTYAEILFQSFPIGFPFTRISPSIFPMFFLPAKMSKKVVFPAPDSPSIAVTFPGAAYPLIPCKILS